MSAALSVCPADSKEAYRQLCEARGAEVPLFQQHWWMEAVCRGKRWEVMLVRRGDQVVGALPYLLGSRLGMSFVVQPQLTQFSGPWVAPELGFDAAMKVMDSMATGLDAMRLALYSQRFSPTVTNWLPFYWHGYGQTTRYTYRLPSLADVEGLMRGAMYLRRRHNAAVAEVCRVDKALGVDEFGALHQDYFRRRGTTDWVPLPLLHTLCTTAIRRGQGLLHGLRRRSDGRLMAGLFVAFDSQWGYPMLLAIDSQAPEGAMTYLIWQVLAELSAHTRGFDFEGSMEQGLEFFYRSFGAEQTPYFEVSRFGSPLGRMMLWWKQRQS